MSVHKPDDESSHNGHGGTVPFDVTLYGQPLPVSCKDDGSPSQATELLTSNVHFPDGSNLGHFERKVKE